MVPRGGIWMKRIMNDIGNTMEISEEVKLYREKIVEMVGQIENRDILEYLHTFIQIFLEKWG